MLDMIPKALDSIAKTDIDALLANKVPEGRSLDYKLTLPGGKDEEKKEFLADVSSFSNSTGGDIVFGVSEVGGVPANVPGLNVADLDAEKLRLEGVIRDGIEPRIIGVQIQSVSGFPSGPVLVIRIPRSFAAPHMVTFKNSSRFFTRNSAGKYQMDVAELRTAFDISGSLGERLQRFRTDRLAKIIAGETPVRIKNSAKAILHIFPLSSFSLTSYIALKIKQTIIQRLSPVQLGAFGHHNNLEGFVSYAGITGGQNSSSYCQFFRNGMVEAAYTNMFYATDTGEAFIDTARFERQLVSSVESYLGGLGELGVPVPLLITVSLIGVKGAWLDAGPNTSRFESAPVDRDTALLPDVIVESYDVEVPRVMRPIFDALWNSGGYERSFYYDDEGNWVLR